ncbi:MAG: hypothetical protein ACK567_03155 [Chitinophagales bacterium]
MSEAVEIIEQKLNFKGLIDSLDIKPEEYLLPLNEAIVNSLQSLEDSKLELKKQEILIDIHRKARTDLDFPSEASGYIPIDSFTIYDNGVGFTNERVDAFGTPFTNFNLKKGGKGVGRYTVLACFKNIDIDSSFESDSKYYTRKYKFDNKLGFQKYPENVSESGENIQLITKVMLSSYREPFLKYIINKQISINDIANGIIQHCLLYFINPDKIPLIRLKYSEQNIKDAMILNDNYKNVLEIEKTDTIPVPNLKEPLRLTYIRNYEPVHAHSFHLCANLRQVGNKTTLTEYIPSFKEFYNGDRKYHINVYVESDYLDNNNNPQRNRFTIPDRPDKKELFNKVSLEEIYEVVSANVRETYKEHIQKSEFEKNEKVRDYILNPKKPRYGYRYLLNIPEAFITIPINASEDTLEEKLHEIEYKLEQKRSKAFDKALGKRKFDKEEFSEIINNVLREEAQFSKDKLADLIVRRKAVINLFRKYLEYRHEDKYMLEADLHNIIFTMGADTDNIPNGYHNLWLLDERFNFHTFTASDKKNKSNKKLESEGNLEPDIAIYDIPQVFTDNVDKINSLVVFELKKPGMEFPDNTKLDSLIEKYFMQLLESKVKSEKGRPINITNDNTKYGYVICELNPKIEEFNKKWNGFKKSPFGNLYKINPDLNLHIEVMTYTQLLEFAEQRHEVFFRALGIV